MPKQNLFQKLPRLSKRKTILSLALGVVFAGASTASAAPINPPTLRFTSAVVNASAPVRTGPVTIMGHSNGVDDTAQIQALINSSGAGATIVFPGVAAGGVYHVEASIFPLAGDHFTWNGVDRPTIYRQSALTSKTLIDASHVVSTSVAPLEIDHIDFKGNNVVGKYTSSLANQNFIYVRRGSSWVNVHDDTASGAYGDFIDVQNGPQCSGCISSNVTIDNNTVLDSGRQDISIISGDTVAVTNNRLGQANYNAVDIEGNGAWDTVKNVTIRHNIETHSMNAGYFVACCGGASSAMNIVVDSNTESPTSGSTATFFGTTPGAVRSGLTLTNNINVNYPHGRSGTALAYNRVMGWDKVTIGGNTGNCSTAYKYGEYGSKLTTVTHATSTDVMSNFPGCKAPFLSLP